MSRIVQSFAKKALISRKPSKDDGRRFILSLTAKGRAAFDGLNRSSHDNTGRMFDRLQTSDQQRLVNALATVEHPRIRKVLARLDAHPVATVAVLRLFLFLTPALNYVLAMTNVKYRHYLAGSALGLAVPIGVVAVAFEWVLAHVG